MSRNLKHAFDDEYEVDEYGDPIRRNETPHDVETVLDTDLDDESPTLTFPCTRTMLDNTRCAGYVMFYDDEEFATCTSCRVEFDRDGYETIDVIYGDEMRSLADEYEDELANQLPGVSYSGYTELGRLPV